MSTRTTNQRFRAVIERIDIAHMQNNGKRLALLNYGLVLLMDEEMSDAFASAAILEAQVKPYEGPGDLLRYVVDLTRANVRSAAAMEVKETPATA